MATENYDSTFRRINTPEDGTIPAYASVVDYSNHSTDYMIPYSDSDDDDDDGTDYEDEGQFQHVHQVPSSRLEESDAIEILGSLCHQGIYQGMSQDNPRAGWGKFLPGSVRMTSALERVSHELDTLSVMVTKNLELVAVNSPFSKKDQKKCMLYSCGIKYLRFFVHIASFKVRSKEKLPSMKSHATTVTYIDNIVRPQPLPPISTTLPQKEVSILLL